jgi:hypothetical protein
MSLKDILEILLIPIVLVFIPLIWAFIQKKYRKSALTGLIVRELEELSPYPDKRADGLIEWTDYQKKNFIHQEIFKKPGDFKEYILELDPELVYFVSQLWDAKKNFDSEQWLYYLGKLTNYFPNNKSIKECHEKWKFLLNCFSWNISPKKP